MINLSNIQTDFPSVFLKFDNKLDSDSNSNSDNGMNLRLQLVITMLMMVLIKVIVVNSMETLEILLILQKNHQHTLATTQGE